MIILAVYKRSIFQDFKRFLRTEIDLVEDDIRLVWDEFNSSFITCEIRPGNYTLKDISGVCLRILQPEYPGYHNAIDIEFNDITKKTKLTVRKGIIAVRFDEKSFFSTMLRFTHWDYKYCNEYISQKFVNLSTKNKIHLKCHVIDGSIESGVRQPVLISFVLDKLAVTRLFRKLRQYTTKK